MAEGNADVSGFGIVLGTTSQWRRALFAKHFPNMKFGVAAADIDEKAVTAGFSDRSVADPQRLTLAIARAKASAILPTLPKDVLLVTSDQVLAYNGHIREKPEDADECREYLKSYRVESVDVAEQHFAELPDSVIDALIAKGDVLRSAGGFTVEDPLMAPYLRKRVGTMESIMGLPVEPLQRLLHEASSS